LGDNIDSPKGARKIFVSVGKVYGGFHLVYFLGWAHGEVGLTCIINSSCLAAHILRAHGDSAPSVLAATYKKICSANHKNPGNNQPPAIRDQFFVHAISHKRHRNTGTE
jgi:hypothetical protein